MSAKRDPAEAAEPLINKQEVTIMTQKDVAIKARFYRELQAMIKELQDEADTVKGEITAHMDATDEYTIAADTYTVRWTPYVASRIDVAAIKQELPDIAERYTINTQARRFFVA